MVAHTKANGAWGLNNLIWPIGPPLRRNSLLTGSAELQIASTHAQTVACQPILPSLTQLALINAWSLMLMPSQVPAFNTWSLKCLRWMSNLLPEMRPVVFVWIFRRTLGVVGEYRWSGPLSSLSDGHLSEQRVWDVLHSCMLRPAILQHSNQTATNTISAALLRHSDLSPQSVFSFSHSFSLSVKYTVLGQRVILLVSPWADTALCTVGLFSELLFKQEGAIVSYFGSAHKW